jgi:hypothetical protein
MRLAHAFLLGVLATSSIACLRKTEFQCSSSAECGPGGTCQTAVGYCSVTDNDCASGQRYSDSAGSSAGECVGGGPFDDASNPDAPIPSDGSDDAPPDGPSVGCPSGYAAITGGQTGHLYQLVTTTGNWTNQRNFCTATSANAYLVIPDNADELAALVELATSTRFWVGITDMVTEGTWVNTLGQPQTFLPWEMNRPNMSGNNNDDCVFAEDNGGDDPTLRDDRCNNVQLPAICECVP